MFHVNTHKREMVRGWLLVQSYFSWINNHALRYRCVEFMIVLLFQIYELKETKQEREWCWLSGCRQQWYHILYYVTCTFSMDFSSYKYIVPFFPSKEENSIQYINKCTEIFNLNLLQNEHTNWISAVSILKSENIDLFQFEDILIDWNNIQCRPIIHSTKVICLKVFK